MIEDRVGFRVSKKFITERADKQELLRLQLLVKQKLKKMSERS